MDGISGISGEVIIGESGYIGEKLNISAESRKKSAKNQIYRRNRGRNRRKIKYIGGIGRISAKTQIYRRNWGRNRRKIRYIGGTEEDIGEKSDISAESRKKSAKNQIYRRNWGRNRRKIRYIGGIGKDIGETKFISNSKVPKDRNKSKKLVVKDIIISSQ
ncbi:hypothetical protein [Metabacillus sp. Hm71]|uniref:hypothetical protein n=1 Tax=Metabacillus sp. Hm71 TaxID=3450743 RepID=UPI003F420D5C